MFQTFTISPKYTFTKSQLPIFHPKFLMNDTTPTPTSRQARRRRIVEQGTDRFALITGRIQSLPSPSDKSPSDTCPPPDLHSFDDSINREDEGSTPLSHNKPISEISTESIGPGAVMPEQETGVEESIVPLLNSHFPEPPSQLSSTSLDTRDSPPERHVGPITRQFDFFRPKEISSAVTSTEWTRIYCSLAAAIIVVFAYVGFPILGIIKGVVLFRPLYLLILTNISIVALHILSQQQRRLERARQREGDVPSGSGLNQLGNALEIGLLLQKAMGSLFMDCSIFSVVVVCGVSIANTLGW